MQHWAKMGSGIHAESCEWTQRIHNSYRMLFKSTFAMSPLQSKDLSVFSNFGFYDALMRKTRKLTTQTIFYF